MINLFYRLKYCKSVHYMQCSLKYGVEGGKREEGEVLGFGVYKWSNMEKGKSGNGTTHKWL